MVYHCAGLLAKSAIMAGRNSLPIIAQLSHDIAMEHIEQVAIRLDLQDIFGVAAASEKFGMKPVEIGKAQIEFANLRSLQKRVDLPACDCSRADEILIFQEQRIGAMNGVPMPEMVRPQAGPVSSGNDVF